MCKIEMNEELPKKMCAESLAVAVAVAQEVVVRSVKEKAFIVGF